MRSNNSLNLINKLNNSSINMYDRVTNAHYTQTFIKYKNQ